MTPNQLPPLPEPDTHCFDDDTGKDVWSYTADQMRAYALAALQAAQAALTAAKAGGWQDISTAPKDGTRFIAWRKYSTRPLIARYWKDFGWFEDEDGLHLYNLTHWQPLPNPPKEQA